MFSSTIPSNLIDSPLFFEKQLEQIVDSNDKSVLLKTFDYLLSSINANEINNFIDTILELLINKLNIEKEDGPSTQLERTPILSNKIMLSNSDGKHLIEINDIIRFESDGNYTLIHVRNTKPILISKTLKEFESQFLEHNFERVHQSHLININYVKSITNGSALTIELDDLTVIPVSRRKKEQVIKVLKLKKPLLIH